MHIGVEQGAAKGYVPPNGKAWVDVIRTKGNEANHQIQLMNAGDASCFSRSSRCC
jgi:hypothetical protein